MKNKKIKGFLPLPIKGDIKIVKVSDDHYNVYWITNEGRNYVNRYCCHSSGKFFPISKVDIKEIEVAGLKYYYAAK
jgi:hypothetical protein